VEPPLALNSVTYKFVRKLADIESEMPRPSSIIHAKEPPVGYPRVWKTFHNHFSPRKSEKQIPMGVLYEAAVLFGTRFRMANSFQGLRMNSGYADPTLKAYEALLGFSLTWSAMEQLWKVCEEKSCGRKGATDQHAFFDSIFEQLGGRSVESIIIDYRGNESLHETLLKKINSNNKLLRTGLEELYEGKNRNLRFLGSALRNAFTHGAFAAHTGGRPVSTARICRRMRELLLATIEEVFEKWVHKTMEMEIDN